MCHSTYVEARGQLESVRGLPRLQNNVMVIFNKEHLTQTKKLKKRGGGAGDAGDLQLSGGCLVLPRS